MSSISVSNNHNNHHIMEYNGHYSNHHHNYPYHQQGQGFYQIDTQQTEPFPEATPKFQSELQYQPTASFHPNSQKSSIPGVRTSNQYQYQHQSQQQSFEQEHETKIRDQIDSLIHLLEPLDDTKEEKRGMPKRSKYHKSPFNNQPQNHVPFYTKSPKSLSPISTKEFNQRFDKSPIYKRILTNQNSGVATPSPPQHNYDNYRGGGNSSIEIQRTNGRQTPRSPGSIKKNQSTTLTATPPRSVSPIKKSDPQLMLLAMQDKYRSPSRGGGGGLHSFHISQSAATPKQSNKDLYTPSISPDPNNSRNNRFQYRRNPTYRPNNEAIYSKYNIATPLRKDHSSEGQTIYLSQQQQQLSSVEQSQQNQSNSNSEQTLKQQQQQPYNGYIAMQNKIKSNSSKQEVTQVNSTIELNNNSYPELPITSYVEKYINNEVPDASFEKEISKTLQQMNQRVDDVKIKEKVAQNKIGALLDQFQLGIKKMKDPERYNANKQRSLTPQKKPTYYEKHHQPVKFDYKELDKERAMKQALKQREEEAKRLKEENDEKLGLNKKKPKNNFQTLKEIVESRIKDLNDI